MTIGGFNPKIYLLLWVVLIFCANLSSLEAQSVAGLIRVSGTQQAVSMRGQWHYAVGDNLDWSLEAFDHSDWPLAIIPGDWRRLGYSQTDSLWYRAHLKLEADWQDRDLAIFSPRASHACEIYFNGHLVDRQGRISEDGILLKMSNQVSLTWIHQSIINRQGLNSIAYRFKSTTFNGGFILPDFWVGDPTAVKKEYEKYQVYHFILVGFFLFTAIFHLLIFFGRIGHWHYLFFSLYALSVTAYVLGAKNLSHYIWDNYWFSQFMIHGSIMLAPILLVSFFQSFLEVSNKLASRLAWLMGTLGLAAVSAAMVSLAIWDFYLNRLFIFFFSFLQLFFFYFVWLTLKTKRVDKWERASICLGIVIYSVAIFADGINYFAAIELHWHAEEGFAAFIFGLSLAISRRLTSVYNQTQRLNVELTRAQQSLLESKKLLKKRNLELDKDIQDYTIRLRESLSFLQSLMNAIPVAIFFKNIEGKYVEANRAFEDFVGLGKEKIIGKTVFDVFSPEMAEFYHQKDLELLNKKGKQSFETMIMANENLPRYVMFHKALLDDGQGETAGLVGVIFDLTERRIMEEELNKLKNAVESSPACIVITDFDGRIEYVNPSFCQITGWSREEAIGNNPRILKTGHHSPSFYEHLWDTIKSGKIWRGELQNRKKNSEVYWEWAQISPIKNSKGVITHFTAVKENITERKRIERLRADTERVVRHDLKTPISQVISLSELLLDEIVSGEQKKMLEMIHDVGWEMLTMIEHSLDLFRMEEGTYQPIAEKILISESLEKVKQTLAALCQKKKVMLDIQENIPVDVQGDSHFETRFEKQFGIKNTEKSFSSINDHIYVLGEKRYIERMLLNLIKNAIEAMALPGKVSIRVWQKQESYCFDIHNPGIIPETIRDRFFDPYATSGKKGGSGLGTYSARIIARAHGGDIRFTTSESEGTHVIVELPMAFVDRPNASKTVH